MGNKVTWGLSKLAYAIETITAGVMSYGTPVDIPGAVDMSAAPRGDAQEFEADNIVYWRMQPNDGYDITANVAAVPEAFLEDVMGDLVDNKGVAFEKNDATIKRVALLGQIDGDEKPIRFVFYNCLPKRTNIDGATSRKKEPKTRPMAFTCDPRADGYVKAATTSAVDETVYNNWFDSVCAAPVTAPAQGD